MKCDFTTVMDRGGRNTLAVDGYGVMLSDCTVREGVEPIPMWVADMSFATVPTVPQQIIERVNHPEYGCFITPDEYYDSIIRWHETRNGVTGLTGECIRMNLALPHSKLVEAMDRLRTAIKALE